MKKLSGILMLCLLWFFQTGQSQEAITLRVLTYNTHLFGDLAMFKALDAIPNVKIGDKEPKDVRWEDENRKQQLKDYLTTKPADIVLLQELWSGAYANNIKHDERTENLYPNFYALDAHHGKFNTAGLAILTTAGINISDAQFFNYINNCNKDGFKDQDKFSTKGLLQLTGRITSEFNSSIPSGQSIPVGIFFTHMITNINSVEKSADCCFQAIADRIRAFRQNNPDAIVLFTGDLNVQYSEYTNEEAKTGPLVVSSKYKTYVQNKLLTPELGLRDVYATRRQLSGKSIDEDKGYTIDNAANAVSQHFDKSNTRKNQIDYIFYASSKSGKTSIILPSANDTYVINNIKTSKGIDVSDHYALKAVFSISSPLLQHADTKYSWIDAGTVAATSDQTVEVNAGLSLPNDAGKVVVGVGAKVSGNDVRTLVLQVAPIDMNGNIGRPDMRKFGQAPEESLEVMGNVGPQEVVVGIGLRASDSNLKTMALWGQRLDPASGKLVGPIKEYRFGKDANGNLEVRWVAAADEQRFITGIGLRAKDNNMKGLAVHTGRIAPGNSVQASTRRPENELYQANGEQAVFVIKNGVRRWVPDGQTFEAMGLNWGKIVKVDRAKLESIPAGAPLPSRMNGTLLQGSGAEVYVMKDRKRSWITSRAVFDQNKYNWSDVQRISDEDLAAIPKGPDLR